MECFEATLTILELTCGIADNEVIFSTEFLRALRDIKPLEFLISIETPKDTSLHRTTSYERRCIKIGGAVRHVRERYEMKRKQHCQGDAPNLDTTHICRAAPSRRILMELDKLASSIT